jgi:hypothetical protein
MLDLCSRFPRAAVVLGIWALASMGMNCLKGFLAIAAFSSTGALVSDGAATRLHPTGFDHTIAGEQP